MNAPATDMWASADTTPSICSGDVLTQAHLDNRPTRSPSTTRRSEDARPAKR